MWPPYALLAVDLSFSSVEAFSVDPARYEADINGQLHNTHCVSSGWDVVISPQGGQKCLA